MRETIPLRQRKLDFAFIGFFIINFGFITYIVDLEQLVIDDPSNFEYPIWPPAALVDLVHWWGNTFDPVLMARPDWWRATIWIDQIFFGPFYAFAIYAFIRGREWIRNWCFIWAGLMTANVTIILSEEIWGPHASPELAIVLLANASWLLFPTFLCLRMWKPHPFTRPAAAPSTAA